MKKVFFTDSNNKDFEFRIDGKIITFCYVRDGFPNFKFPLLISEIESDKFPPSLNNFKEATTYLKKYIENIAFV